MKSNKRKQRTIFITVFAVFTIALLCLFCINHILNQKIVVAVLDTGYTGENERVLTGFNTMDDNDDILDFHGHGTAVSNLILEKTSDRVVVLPVKITDNYGQATLESAYAGIVYAVEQGADIINFSLVMENLSDTEELSALIDRTVESGIEVIIPAGNYGTDTNSVFPANNKKAIVVSAVDKDYEFCDYSNYGDTIDYAAYGYYDGDRGTSYAAARVSAVLANAFADKNTVGSLKEIAVDKGEPGWDAYYGYGVLATEDSEEEVVKEEEYQKKSVNDLGYDIMSIDWKTVDEKILNNYFVETNRAYVGMYLLQLNEIERKELAEKADILKSDILVQNFSKNEETNLYEETNQYQINFTEHAIDEYNSYKNRLFYIIFTSFS